MKRESATKFSGSSELFKFSQKILEELRNQSVKDQDVGEILGFNPSDCSHWKRGEKSLKSIFHLKSLSEALQVDRGLIYDLANGHVRVEEAYYEIRFARVINKIMNSCSKELLHEKSKVVDQFCNQLLRGHSQKNVPIYTPEVIQQFSFISTQATEMVDKLSRTIKSKDGKYIIQYRRGDLKSQTRMSIISELSRILFEFERSKYPELGAYQEEHILLEKLLFVANVLVPKAQLSRELHNIPLHKNASQELTAMFWSPRVLIDYQIRNIIEGRSNAIQAPLGDVRAASLLT